MYTLKLEHTFSAAHQLTNAYDEKCNKSLHGHNWKVSVEILTYSLQDGMVVDFTRIKEIIDKLDHKNLNEVLDFEPTAEHIAKYLYDEILKLTNLKSKVTIWEAEKASITYTI